jgi:hypothetical protein
VNKISNSDALPLGDLQHFSDGAFYKPRRWFCGLFVLSKVIHLLVVASLMKAGIFYKANRRMDTSACSGRFEVSQLDLQISDPSGSAIREAAIVLRLHDMRQNEYPMYGTALLHEPISGKHCRRIKADRKAG